MINVDISNKKQPKDTYEEWMGTLFPLVERRKLLKELVRPQTNS